VHLIDGASLAHMGHPDMRVPISYALHYPDRTDVPLERLDLAAVGELTFERPDTDTFRCLALAREAGERGGTAPCILNAANEEAVAAFLAGTLPFAGIPEVVAATLEEVPAHEPAHFEDLFDCDAAARKAAAGIAGRIAARASEPAATNGAPR
jgi:1-deoxy-D-xylulose-5-phosphate reductoisomerase